MTLTPSHRISRFSGLPGQGFGWRITGLCSYPFSKVVLLRLRCIIGTRTNGGE